MIPLWRQICWPRTLLPKNLMPSGMWTKVDPLAECSPSDFCNVAVVTGELIP
jgi:hypothetical protein